MSLININLSAISKNEYSWINKKSVVEYLLVANYIKKYVRFLFKKEKVHILIMAKVINQPKLFFPTRVLFHLLCTKDIIQFHPRLYYYSY
ncbi:MAG: hypothetical protein CMF99_03325 [Candidatus Marinimicrobia bacterium]|nr:hypothetical protein [Candidatus Neomarinimicrobiota bacterium]